MACCNWTGESNRDRAQAVKIGLEGGKGPQTRGVNSRRDTAPNFT